MHGWAEVSQMSNKDKKVVNFCRSWMENDRVVFETGVKCFHY